MSKMIKLWTAATVNGRLRQPTDGILHLEDDEANRLIADGAGEDVTGDFSKEQREAQPVESLTAVVPAPPPAAQPFDPRAEEAKVIAERQAAAAPQPGTFDHDGDGRPGGSKPKPKG